MLYKSHNVKWLGEEISLLVLPWNMLYLQSPILTILSEEVIFYIDVRGPWLSLNILHWMMGVST
jgi:hypothetical protein